MAVKFHKDQTGADLHEPKAHKTSHEAGGSDEINTVKITGGTITGITDITVADGGTGASTAFGARTNLGLVIGTDIQAYDAGLASIAGLNTSANRMLYLTASDTYTATDLTAFARSILDDADEATFKATVNLEIGTDVQAYDVALTSVSGLTYVSASFIKLTANDTYAVRTLDETKTDLDVDDLEEYQGYSESPIVVSGGDISKGTGATYTVAAGTGLFRTTDSVTGELAKTAWSQFANQAITAANTTYIVYLSYNGGSPTLHTSETSPYTANKMNITLGKVMKDGSDNVHFVNGGFGFQDGVRKLHKRASTLRAFELDDGSTMAYKATNYITMSAGKVYHGINELPLAVYDSSATTYTPIRTNGATFIEDTPTNAIDFAHYDAEDGTLGSVGNNKYGVFWIYRHVGDGHVYIRYGVGSYSLAAAEVTKEPSKPDHLTDFGRLIGRIIVPYDGGEFTIIDMVTDRFFVGTSVGDHAQLGNLQGGTTDEYYHLTSAQHTIATQAATTSVSGYLSSTDWATFNSKAEADQTMYIGTTAVAINRGTAALTLTGITLTTPDIGTPSAGILTNCTFPTLNQNTTGSSGSCTGNAASVTNGVYTTSNVNVLNDITSTGANIEDAVTKKHTQGTDQSLDSGGANEVLVADAKDAVDKKHSQNTDTALGPLTADIDLNGHDLSGNDKISKSTKAARTIYCNKTTGDDSTGDGSSGSPFATIQHAIDTLPEVISEDITIAVGADETYSAAITTEGHICVDSLIIKAMDASDNELYTHGTATGGSATTLVHTGAGWTNDFWIGANLLILSGTGVGEIRAISGNTDDTLTVANGTTPDNTTDYIIVKIVLTSSGVPNVQTYANNTNIYGFEFTGNTGSIIHLKNTQRTFIYYCYIDATNSTNCIYDREGSTGCRFYYGYIKVKTYGITSQGTTILSVRYSCFKAAASGVGTGLSADALSSMFLGWAAGNLNTFINLATGVKALNNGTISFGSTQTYINCTADYTPAAAGDAAYIS